MEQINKADEYSKFEDEEIKEESPDRVKDLENEQSIMNSELF